MADPGLFIRLNQNAPEFVANPQMWRKTLIPIGTTWEKRNFFPSSAAPVGTPYRPGAGATTGILIDANGYRMPRASWLDARPELLGELALLVDKGKILVIDEASSIQLTPEEIHLRDLPETVQQAAGVVAETANPTLPADGVDTRGYRFSYRVTPTVTPADATFQLWVFNQSDQAGNGVWSAVGDPVQVNTDQSTILEVSASVQASAARAFIEVETYVSGTWTLDVIRRVSSKT